jgi:hypothetical protein
MSDKKASDRGVVDSIARLREIRYMTKGPGAARARAPKKPTIDKLRSDVAKVEKKTKKAKQGKRR